VDHGSADARIGSTACLNLLMTGMMLLCPGSRPARLCPLVPEGTAEAITAQGGATSRQRVSGALRLRHEAVAFRSDRGV
jgi:hypothetical protein